MEQDLYPPGSVQARLRKISHRFWIVEDRALTGDHVVAFFEWLHDTGEAAPELLGAETMSSRRCQRATAILKRAGLIRFDRLAWRWEVSP